MGLSVSLACFGSNPLCYNNGETFCVGKLDLGFDVLLVLKVLIILTHHQSSGVLNCSRVETSIDCSYDWVVGGEPGYWALIE